ncbi:MAG: hypothetical protein WBB01_09475, partial [Phormidesmis sp.]
SDASPGDPPAPLAEPVPRQNTAQSTENAPTLESAPAGPESATVSPPRAMPAPPAVQSAPTAEAPLPSAPEPPSPAVTAEEDLPSEPPPAAETATQSQREAQAEIQQQAQADTPDPADINPPPIPAQSAAGQRAARAPNENYQVSASTTADLQVEVSDTIAQVQRYFQARWQAGDQAVQLPLAYELELSSSGEVARLTGLSEAAQTYGDRLLPPTPLTFSYSADESLTLRLTITADGIVEVSKH